MEQSQTENRDAGDLTVGLGMRCEGWRRYGGAFTFGPVKWAQCDNNAIVVLRVEQEKIEELPACAECWQEALDNKMEILEVKPIIPNA